MTVPALRVSPECEPTIDVLVIGVLKSEDGPRLLSDDPALAALAESLAIIGITGGVDEVRRLPAPSGVARSLALVGVGATLGTNQLRYAAGSAARQLRGVASIALALPLETRDDLLAVLEGAAIGAYSFTEFRTQKVDATTLPATEVVVVSSFQKTDALITRATTIATAMHTVRDLANRPPSHLYPETFADTAAELAAGSPVTLEVLDEAALEAGEFGGILGVGRGSVHPPRLVKISYDPKGATKHLALVGKGITFDTGGISLKPPASMVGMKYDMVGAAAVLGITLALAQLGVNLKVTGWLCLAENMPSGSALKPNDVVRMKGGKTVEVLNTDAEGRLVLADALVAASEEHPDAIIDVATLTGAQRTALGDRYSGAMGDDALVAQLVEVATRVGEQLWPMPLPDDVRAILTSDIADLANAKPGNIAAGMLQGGLFLSEFVGNTGEGDDKHRIPWVHLDIAAPSNNKGNGFGFTGKGPTGVTVRALIALAEEFSYR